MVRRRYPVRSRETASNQPVVNSSAVCSFDILNAMSAQRKQKNKCRVCGVETARARYVYCSNACQVEYQYQVYIENWKAGKVTGLKAIGIVSRPVKRYLRRKYEDKCFLCCWSKVNIITGQVPLVADHIDGNWQNNIESNLRLICPNCDSLSPTYANLNKGNGRKNRAVSKRAQHGRLILKKKPP